MVDHTLGTTDSPRI